MIILDDVINEKIEENDPKCPETPDYQYRILKVGDSGSGKTNSLVNLISKQPNIDKVYSYAKDQVLINKGESTGLNHFNDSKTFMEYSNDMNDVYKNLEEYKPSKKRKI